MFFYLSAPQGTAPKQHLVSDCSSESYEITEYIYGFVNSLSELKDTYEFVNTIKHLQVSSHTLLFPVDVEALYTNIETPLGHWCHSNHFQ